MDKDEKTTAQKTWQGDRCSAFEFYPPPFRIADRSRSQPGQYPMSVLKTRLRQPPFFNRFVEMFQQDLSQRRAVQDVSVFAIGVGPANAAGEFQLG